MSQERNSPTRRPLTARSVVASLVLGTRRGRLPGSALVRAGTRFGFAEGTTRVALSRMVAAGELSTAAGEYELAGPLLERHGRQEEGRRPRLRRWDGTWRAAVVGSGGAPRPAAERAAVRRQLAGARMAEWREGVWIRPDNLAADPPDVDGCTWVSGMRFVDEGEAQDLADKLWAPRAWAASASALAAEMADTPPAAEDIAESFQLAAAVVRHLRDDPLLPDTVLPATWPGSALRAAYDKYEAALSLELGSVLG